MLKKTKTHYTAFYAILMVLVILSYQFVRPASASPYGATDANTSSSGIRSAIAPGIAGSLLNMMVASLDGDGVEESVIVVTDAGVFAVELGVNDSSLDLFYPSPSRVLDLAVLSDSDGNGRNEIAIATYDVSLPNIVVFDIGTGQELWHHRHEVLTYDFEEQYASDFVKRQTFTWSIAGVDDLNGDAKKELVVGSWDTVLMLDGASGDELWSFQADNDVWQVSSADDVTGDGKPDVLAGTQDGTVYLIDGFSGTLMWSVALSEPYVFETGTVKRAIWDVFSIRGVLGDATPAVVASSEDGYVYLLDGRNGAVVWKYQSFEISVPSKKQTEFGGADFFNLRAFLIDDITGDFAQDIIVLDNSESNTAVQAINSKTGTLVWEKTGLTPSFYDVETASNVVANFTVLLLPTGNSFSAELGQMVEEILVIDGENGNEIDGFRVPVANYYATAGETRIVDVMTDVSGDEVPDVALALDGGTIILFSPVDGKVLSDFPWVRKTILQEGNFVGNTSTDILLISKESTMGGWQADRFTSRMFAVIDGATCLVSWSYFVPWDEYLKTGGLRRVQAVSDVNGDGKSDIIYYTGPSDFDTMVSGPETSYNAYYRPQINATVVSGTKGEVIWSTTVPSWSLTTKSADFDSTTEDITYLVHGEGFSGNLSDTFMDDGVFHSFTNDSSGLARVPYRIDLNPYLIWSPFGYPTLRGMGNLEVRVKAGVNDTSGLAFAGLQIWKRNTTELLNINSKAFNFTEPKELNFTLSADDLDSYAKWFPGDPWNAQLTLFVTVDTGNVTQTIRVFVDLVQFTFHNPCKENVPKDVSREKMYNIYSIDQLDDVDGDGFRDFVVGSSQIFYIVSGHTGKDILNRMQLTYHTDNVTIQSWHVYAHAIDDITGDGKRDIVLAGDGPNYIRIVSSDGNFTNQISFMSELRNFDPITVNVIDDVNGDNMPDLSVFIQEEEAPYIRVLGSPNFDVTHFQIRWDINPTVKYAAGDLDGDGVKDTIVTAPRGEEGASIFVLSGATGSTIWTWDLGRMEVWTWEKTFLKGFEATEFMPATVVDDITGDGVDDLVIAYTDQNPEQAHEIAVINVKDATLHSTISFKERAARAGDWTLKIPVLGMTQFRDITGDGSRELAFSIGYPPSREEWMTEYVVVDYRSSGDAKILLRTPFTSLSMVDTQEYVVLNTYVGAIFFPNLDFGVSITQPENTEKSFSGAVTLAWDVEGEIALQEVFLDGFSYGRVDGNSFILNLASGRHAVEVRVTDRFGVSASDTLFITVQRNNSLYQVLNVIFGVAIVNLIIWKFVGSKILGKLRPKFKSRSSSNQRTNTKKNGGASS